LQYRWYFPLDVRVVHAGMAAALESLDRKLGRASQTASVALAGYLRVEVDGVAVTSAMMPVKVMPRQARI
jgi:hypothetical protein